MKVLSVNVGKPVEREWKGLRVSTSIFKHPVEGTVKVGLYDLEGDEQADLSVHGGANKAVYVFPFEHYSYWKRMLPATDLTMGNFGENLTTEGVSEEEIHVGDELEIGTARFLVTQPRLPCYKLGFRFEREDMVKLFFQSRRFGFYLRVLREGVLQAGSAVTVLSRDPNNVSVADLVRLATRATSDPELLKRALSLPMLPKGFREELPEG